MKQRQAKIQAKSPCGFVNTLWYRKWHRLLSVNGFSAAEFTPDRPAASDNSHWAGYLATYGLFYHGATEKR